MIVLNVVLVCNVALAAWSPLTRKTVREWKKFLPAENAEADYCTTRDESATRWLQKVYEETFIRSQGACSQKRRIGSAGDGGKIMCEKDISTARNCVIYSLGSRLDFSFEMSVRETLPKCKVYTFDCTVGSNVSGMVPDGVEFFPWCVGGKDELKEISSDFGHTGETGQYHTLDSIKKRLGHGEVDLLKMDIERHELSVWKTITAASAPRQVLFETHLHNAYGLWNRPMCSREWLDLWHHIRRLKYKTFSYEPNSDCPCCSEWSVHRS